MFITAKQADRTGAQPLHGKRKIRQPIMTSEGFADQAQTAYIDMFASSAFQKTCLTQVANELNAGCIHIGVLARQFCVAPCFQARGKIAMPVLKEGPLKKLLIAH